MARHAGGAGRAAQADYQALQAMLGAVDGQFHLLLLRRLALRRAAPVDEGDHRRAHGAAARARLRQGRPLRALAVAGNDSKFF